ncbi:MAG: 6,7-dimethyl-8-ribityllumazine synthase [Planctomycetota bacterium]|nr:6,7-dimethyl-8-ribityllumazine synthase [Planctomycetota bacterium]MCX8039375.1 6,7-dimethyl-8-ribityllumazine synthase [Planctomycetota bacterium]
MPRIIEGAVSGSGVRLAIAASRFNSHVVESLLAGALDALQRHHADPQAITIVRVPGAWELPLVVRRLAMSKAYDAIIALGCLIRGETPHFDFIANENAKGLAQAMLESGVPVSNGVLTCDTMEQALARAGLKGGNKGADAALAALEMVDVLRRL